MIKLNKKVLISTFLFFTVLILATATIIREKEKNAPSLDVIRTDTPVVFYFSKSCPHCKIVEQYLTDSRVAEKVKYSMKEVTRNKDNAREVIAKASICGIDKKNLGVPFLWDGEKCYEGDEKIIEFFKAKVQEAEQAAVAAPDGSGGAIILYYGQSCPHCQLVEQFVTENKVEEKVSFTRKEVSQDTDSRDEAISKETACGIAREQMGVPLLTVGSACYMGEEQIIDFFKEKLNEK